MLKMTLQKLLFRLTLTLVLLFKAGYSQQHECVRAVSRARIIGGQDATPEKWPWQVLFEVGKGLCGGSLITDEWVLTAAHCMKSALLNETFIHLGRQNLSGPNPHEVVRTPDKIICHPEFNPRNFNNDICLLKLTYPVVFNDYIRPVCLASSDSTFIDGTPNWITGFGYMANSKLPEALQEVEVPIVGKNRCSCYYKNFGEITENMLCAGLDEGGKDGCQGDSGGPMVSKQDFYWVQSGIVSFGENCALPKKPGVYTRVSRYQEWISDIVTGMEPGFINFTCSDPDRDLNFTCNSTSNGSTFIQDSINTFTTSITSTPTISPATALTSTTAYFPTNTTVTALHSNDVPVTTHTSTLTPTSALTPTSTLTTDPSSIGTSNSTLTIFSTTTTTFTTTNGSIFNGAENLIHFTRIINIFAFVLICHVFVESA